MQLGRQITNRAQGRRARSAAMSTPPSAISALRCVVAHSKLQQRAPRTRAHRLRDDEPDADRVNRSTRIANPTTIHGIDRPRSRLTMGRRWLMDAGL